MEQEIRRSERVGRDFTMLMLDLDDLKPVNDTFGHQWGDRLLTAVAEVLRRTIRFTDTVARYGGDEFLVLLPETDAAGGYIVAETIRRDIAELSLRATDRNVRSSVSIGLVTYPDDGTTMEQLVAAADVAMYESKRRGKNQIVGYRTRTDRVATAIPVAAADLVPLDRPVTAAEVRTQREAPTAHEAPDRHGPPQRAPAGDEPAVVTSVGADAPWLTRTDGPAVPLAGPHQDSQGRPAAEHRSPSQEMSRGEEIRRARERYPERPWIALPIERRDPPSPPAPPRRPRS
jgi:diguanylate cyclase (GGDEF)-like protein